MPDYLKGLTIVWLAVTMGIAMFGIVMVPSLMYEHWGFIGGLVGVILSACIIPTICLITVVISVLIATGGD